MVAMLISQALLRNLERALYCANIDVGRILLRTRHNHKRPGFANLMTQVPFVESLRDRLEFREWGIVLIASKKQAS